MEVDSEGNGAGGSYVDRSGTIRQLADSVVRMIAAGEVVQRPASALKELMENSLDAGATQISVVVGGGGLKFMQIQDNGRGINRLDLPLLCTRFATSKIRCWDDMQQLSSYGFRGEALASISQVAHLSIVTKTADSPCAYKATYCEGNLSADPTPCAGNVGTVLTIEDVFYNMPVRRASLRNANEEYGKIVEVVSRYAIHNCSIGFSLRKQNDPGVDVRTIAGTSAKSNIGNLFGSSLVDNLASFDLSSQELGFKASGFVSTAAYTVSRKFTFLLFINHRLVHSAALKRGLESLYVNYLPKGAHPFVYLGLEILPSQIDVNVHPTKQEVHFLHEIEIIEKIQSAIEAKLVECGQSRTFRLKSLEEVTARSNMLDHISRGVTNGTKSSSLEAVSNGGRQIGAGPANGEDNAERRMYDHELIRTDCREQRLDVMWSASQAISGTQMQSSRGVAHGNDGKCHTDGSLNLEADEDISAIMEVASSRDELVGDDMVPSGSGDEQLDCQDGMPGSNGITRADVHVVHNPSPSSTATGKRRGGGVGSGGDGSVSKRRSVHSVNSGKKRPQDQEDTELIDNDGKHEQEEDGFRVVRLKSVLELQKAIADRCGSSDNSITRPIVRDHTFVGAVNPRLALMQHSTSLYLTNTEALSEELFYQTLLFRFGNMGIIRLSEPAPIRDLALIGLDQPEAQWTTQEEPKMGIAERVRNILTSHSPMLWDYFSIEIRDECLVSLPDLLPGYIPQLDGLPLFILRLALRVDWTGERACFESICRETAGFYSFKAKYCDGEYLSRSDADSSDGETGAPSMTRPTWKSVLTSLLYPAFKTRLLPPADMLKNASMLRLTDLHDLYKVFERC